VQASGHTLFQFDLPGHGPLTAIDLRRLLARRARPLPACMKVVLENVARQALTGGVPAALVDQIADWSPSSGPLTVPLTVTRLMLPDSSGLPVLMDLAAAMDVAVASGADPALVEPVVPITVVVDHSLIVDFAGHPNARARNIQEDVSP